MDNMKNKIDETIKEKLEFYGLTEEDLTAEEMEELREEVETELEGGMILDGVLFNPEILYRKSKIKDDEEKTETEES